MKRSIVVTWAFVLFALIVPFTVGAVDAPHYDPASGMTCVTCHTGHLTLGSTGYNNICQNCHRPGNPVAGLNPFTPADQADPFGNHTTSAVSGRFQTSHRWDGPDTVPAAGARPPIQAAMTSNALRARSGNQLACVRCHDQHSNANGKFLRVPNDQDQLCLDCHRSRNVSSHLQGSHPVNMLYNGAAGAFNKPPVNGNPANPTSDLNARLGASGGKVLCTTCHGVHYTDSHSGTVDGRDNFTNLSSGDGNLLRTDRRGQAVFSGIPDQPNICTNCHAGKKNHNQKSQDVQCTDCHGAHVEYDPNDPANTKGTNAFLIRRNVSKSGRPAQIFFRYTGSRREYKNTQGTGVCQGCHDVPAPGILGAPPEHASNDPKVCNTCHFHNNPSGSFSGSCAGCHGYPPITTTIGGPTGLANPGTNALGAAPASPGAHATHATSRMMTCNTCHNGYSGKTMPSNTIDIGFAINGSNFPGFKGNVSGGTLNGSNALIGYSWSAGPGSTVTPVGNFNTTCSVYCHGSTLTGGSNPNPSWTGAGQAACGSCHGVAPATAPTSGGHGRHAGGGAAGRLAIPCASCHGNHPDKSHVNGNVEWDLTALGPNAQYKTPAGAFARLGGTGAIAPSPAYGQCSNVYCHSSVQGASGIGAAAVYSQPTWGAPALACGSCHADMAGPSATGSHVIHAQINGIACATCHNGLGHDTASHANGSIELAFSGSASGTTYSKGTGFAPGLGYGSCASISCHGGNSASWGGAPVKCQDCHLVATAAVSDLGATFWNNGVVSKLNNASWATSGHGRPAASGPYSRSLNPAADFSAPNACEYCHDTAISHKLAANPFRLRNFGDATWGKNGVCMGCHASGSAGVAVNGVLRNGSVKLSSTHNGILHATSTNKGGQFCWDCHDGHGSSNLYMIQGRMAANSDPASGAPLGALSPVVFTNLSGSSYARSAAPFNGICNVCHTATSHYTSTSGDGHNAGIRCNACHNHSGSGATNAFTPVGGSGCDSCHGYPPATAGFSGSTGNWASAKVENYPGGGGAHTIQSHVSSQASPSDGFANCSRCHNPADHQMSPVAFKPSQNIRVSVNQSLRYENARLARYTSNRVDAATHLTGTCSNISCHFGATPKWDPNH